MLQSIKEPHRQKFLKKISLLLVLGIFLSFGLNAQVFIKQNPTGAGNGTFWNNAADAADLETAILAGGEVYITAGTYFPPQMRLGNNVSITGDYPCTATGSNLSGYDPGTNVTILDGDASGNFPSFNKTLLVDRNKIFKI